MLSISEITKSDAATLAAIHQECFQDYWNEEAFSSMLDQKYFFGFIAKVSSSKVGFIFAKKIFEECEIITFCVLKKYRNLGIGKKLVKKLIDFVLNVCYIKSSALFLEVAVDNFGAIHLYREVGFQEISRRIGYYECPDEKVDAIVMKMEIS